MVGAATTGAAAEVFRAKRARRVRRRAAAAAANMVKMLITANVGGCNVKL